MPPPTFEMAWINSLEYLNTKLFFGFSSFRYFSSVATCILTSLHRFDILKLCKTVNEYREMPTNLQWEIVFFFQKRSAKLHVWFETTLMRVSFEFPFSFWDSAWNVESIVRIFPNKAALGIHLLAELCFSLKNLHGLKFFAKQF